MLRNVVFAAAFCAGCGDPSDQLLQTTGFRVGDEGASSGERGNIVITEVLWSGSVSDEGWDPADVFVEIRNLGTRPVNLEGWFLEMSGPRVRTFRFPASEDALGVGQQWFMAAKTSGCFPKPDWVVPELAFLYGEPFLLTLRDADERLIDAAGSRTDPPYSGSFDGVVSRSMEKVSLMFGGRGTEPHSWHFYTRAEVDVPNNDRMDPRCIERTGASPGRANSPDYSGAFASGDFE